MPDLTDNSTVLTENRGEALRVRTYPALVRALEEGIAYGWRRAHKHTDAPGEAKIKAAIVDAVLLELSEYFDLGP